MAYFLGMDGGGSKTACAVGDEHQVLGQSLAPSCKISRVGEQQARQALHVAILDACKSAGIQPGQIQQACAGIAGATREQAITATRKLMREVLTAPLQVVGDMVIAFEAALGGAAGVIVIAGTGSICYGRNERGETARAGGWGSAVSDEGSGFWIGRRAVAAALRAHDGGQNTALLPAVMNTWHLATRDDVSITANRLSPPPNFAELFPLIKQAAEQGDVIAKQILTAAGCELAQLAEIVLRRLWPGPNRVQVCICGGVLKNSLLVRSAFAEAVRAATPEVAVSYQDVEPMLGALALARKQ